MDDIENKSQDQIQLYTENSLELIDDVKSENLRDIIILKLNELSRLMLNDFNNCGPDFFEKFEPIQDIDSKDIQHIKVILNEYLIKVSTLIPTQKFQIKMLENGKIEKLYAYIKRLLLLQSLFVKYNELITHGNSNLHKMKITFNFLTLLGKRFIRISEYTDPSSPIVPVLINICNIIIVSINLESIKDNKGKNQQANFLSIINYLSVLTNYLNDKIEGYGIIMNNVKKLIYDSKSPLSIGVMFPKNDKK